MASLQGEAFISTSKMTQTSHCPLSPQKTPTGKKEEFVCFGNKFLKMCSEESYPAVDIFNNQLTYFGIQQIPPSHKCLFRIYKGQDTVLRAGRTDRGGGCSHFKEDPRKWGPSPISTQTHRKWKREQTVSHTSTKILPKRPSGSQYKNKRTNRNQEQVFNLRFTINPKSPGRECSKLLILLLFS